MHALNWSIRDWVIVIARPSLPPRNYIIAACEGGSPVDALPLDGKMAASTNGDARSYGKFHPKCGRNVTLSEDRRIASGKPGAFEFPIAFSNDPISKGLQFSVKILQQCSFVSPISASSRPHTSDSPYTAGGAAHVVHCFPFFVRSGYWYLLPATAACCHRLLVATAMREQSVAMGICGKDRIIVRK